MTDHPVTPPRELIEQWASEKCYDERDWLYEIHIATRATQWGADKELEACCKWLEKKGFAFVDELRAALRPKPPSLKEQALEALSEMEDECLMATRAATIRRALEQLDD